MEHGIVQAQTKPAQIYIHVHTPTECLAQSHKPDVIPSSNLWKIGQASGATSSPDGYLEFSFFHSLLVCRLET